MKYLLEPEEKALLRALRDSKSASRDCAIISFVLHTGLRIQECRLLNVGDVWDGYEIKRYLAVRAETAKRCRAREVPLNRDVRNNLRGFIKWKRGKCESLDSSAPLFISRKGNRVGQRTLQDMIEKWCRKAGIRTYTFHSLRHTFSMRLRNRNVKLENIQMLLGHKSLNATGIYLHPSKEELISAVETLSS